MTDNALTVPVHSSVLGTIENMLADGATKLSVMDLFGIDLGVHTDLVEAANQLRLADRDTLDPRQQMLVRYAEVWDTEKRQVLGAEQRLYRMAMGTEDFNAKEFNALVLYLRHNSATYADKNSTVHVDVGRPVSVSVNVTAFGGDS